MVLKNMKRLVGAKRVWSAITRAARVVFGEPSLTCVDKSRNQVVATGPNITGGEKNFREREGEKCREKGEYENLERDGGERGRVKGRRNGGRERCNGERTATIESHASGTSIVMFFHTDTFNPLLGHDIAGCEENLKIDTHSLMDQLMKSR